MVNKIKQWSPAQQWAAVLGSAAILAFAGFVGIGATKGISASEGVCRIEKKVDDQAAKETANAERYGRIEALLESMKEKLDSMGKKIDRHMDKQFDNRH